MNKTNQHPKYGIPNFETRRDNSYQKRQGEYRKIARFMHSHWIWKAGYYTSEYTTHAKRFSYNSAYLRKMGNRKIRRTKEIETSTVSLYKRVFDYVWEIW